MIIEKGNIFLAKLDPTIGSEINKTRPVIIVSNNIGNIYSNTVSVVPVTSNTGRVFPYEVLLEAGEGNLPNYRRQRQIR